MTTQFEAETSFTMHCWARMAVDDDTVVHEVCSTQRVLQRVEDHAYRPNHPGDAESVQGTPALVGLLEQPSERDESVKWLSSTMRTSDLNLAIGPGEADRAERSRHFMIGTGTHQ